MIVSHKHKFIFINTLGTEVNSLETFLAGHCGEADIVTAVNARAEFIRRELGIFPQNSLKSEKYRIPEEKDVEFKTVRELIKFRRKHRYDPSRANFAMNRIYCTHHCKATRVRNLVGAITWHNYYKFCFDRNPWERTINSFYSARKNREIKLATDEQIHAYAKARSGKNTRFRNSSLYTDKNGKVIVNDVFDHALFDDSVKRICDTLGFDFEKYSKQATEAVTQQDKRPYNEFLTQNTIDLIGKIHKKTAVVMGYEALPSVVPSAIS